MGGFSTVAGSVTVRVSVGGAGVPWSLPQANPASITTKTASAGSHSGFVGRSPDMAFIQAGVLILSSICGLPTRIYPQLF